MKTQKIYFAAVALLFMVSFQLPKTINRSKIPTKVQEKIDEEVNKYYLERMLACRLDALTRAEAFVDSVIIYKLDLEILRGIRFPSRPLRPDFPKEIRLNDTIKASPILK